MPLIMCEVWNIKKVGGGEVDIFDSIHNMDIQKLVELLKVQVSPAPSGILTFKLHKLNPHHSESIIAWVQSPAIFLTLHFGRSLRLPLHSSLTALPPTSYFPVNSQTSTHVVNGLLHQLLHEVILRSFKTSSQMSPPLGSFPEETEKVGFFFL